MSKDQQRNGYFRQRRADLMNQGICFQCNSEKAAEGHRKCASCIAINKLNEMARDDEDFAVMNRLAGVRLPVRVKDEDDL